MVNSCQVGRDDATLHVVNEPEEWEGVADDDLEVVQPDDFEVDADEEPWLDDED